MRTGWDSNSWHVILVTSITMLSSQLNQKFISMIEYPWYIIYSNNKCEELIKPKAHPQSNYTEIENIINMSNVRCLLIIKVKNIQIYMYIVYHTICMIRYSLNYVLILVKYRMSTRYSYCVEIVIKSYTSHTHYN